MTAIDALTPRQIDVLNLLVVGETNKQIALALGISVDTVRRHIYAARERTGMNNRVQLIVLYAIYQYRMTVIGDCGDDDKAVLLEA